MRRFKVEPGTVLFITARIMFKNLFKKHCPVCEKEVEKDKAAVRFGKFFCCEEHAEEYRQKLQKEEANNQNHGCCHH